MSETDGTSVVKCGNCGADMVFDPKIGDLKCPYCDSVRHLDKKVPVALNYYEFKNKGAVKQGAVQYRCPNCDGIITLESFSTTANCPFCGATNIVKIEEIPGLKPDSILPFKLDKDSALAAGKKWIKKRIFAPAKAKKIFTADKMNGVYTPSFIFDAATRSTYQGRLGEHYTVTVGSGNNRHTEVRTRWYNVSGNYNRDFASMIIEASKQMVQKEMDKIQPFDVEASESYRREYLAGFCAERYDTPLDESFNVAKGSMEAQIKRDILNKYHADVVDYLNVSTLYPTVNFRYTLVPIWMCSYTYKTKPYRFIVNGRTGRSTGKAPVSALRVALAVLLGLAMIAAIGVVVWYTGLTGDDTSSILPQLYSMLPL